jgi:predicted secreted protein
MIVKGEDVVVYFYDDVLDDYVTYACARSCSFNLTTDTIETSITGQGTFRTFLPTAHSFTGSIEGLVNLDKSSPNLTIGSLLDKQINNTLLLMQFDYRDEDGNFLTLEASFYITGSSLISSFDNVATFNVEFIGTGQLTIIEGS